MSSQLTPIKSILGISGLVSFYGVSMAAIWFLGTALGVTTRVVLIALVLLTIPLALLVGHYRKRREAQAAAGGTLPAARSVTAAAASTPPLQKTAQLPPVTGTYEDLTRATEEAVQWLRGTKLSGAKAGDAVYALPWFVIVGLPSSGKSSLLLSSGLDFHVLPGQRQTDQNLIRPTANCEWRVTDSAILIDTAGRYQSEGPERDEWAALLETIKRYRRNRPLDGLMVTVSAAAVLRWSDTEIEQQAKILRARLDEAILRAQVRFPVYLVFTHIDQIEGFAEFFESFSTDERAQVWGTTIPLAQSPQAHALFDSEFDQLYGRLLRRRVVQLGTSSAPDKQLRILKFPGRFRRTRNRLGLFASALFRPNPFSESPLLRGFYFTSSPGVGSLGARHLAGHEFFAQNIFREVLARDGEIVASTVAERQHPQRWRNVALASAAALVLVFFVGMIVSFFGNKALITETQEHTKGLADIMRLVDRDMPLIDREVPNPVTSNSELTAMERSREILSRLDEYERDSPPLPLRFGLYSGTKLNQEGSIHRHIYFGALSQRFLEPTVTKMKEDLQAFVAGAPPEQLPGGDALSTNATSAASEEYLGRHYDQLKAYLMLVNPERVEPLFLVKELRDQWRMFAPPGKEEEALQQLDYYASQAHRADAPHPEVDAPLVAQAQVKLRDYPLVRRVYKRVISDINAEVKYSIKLATIPGATDFNVLIGSYDLPGAFTLEGHRAMIDKLESSADDEFRRDDWVMTGAQQATEQNFDVKKDDLANIYYTEYIAQWQKFLQEVKVREFRSKEEQVRGLRILAGSTGATSPLDSLLREVARQTNLSAAAGGGVRGWLESLFASKVKANDSQRQVEKEFGPLIKFVAGKDDKSPLAQYRNHLKGVADKMNSSPQQLTEISKGVQAGNNAIGLRAARQAITDMIEIEPMNFSSSTASEAAAQLLKQPLDNLNTLLVGTDFEQMDKDWQQLAARAQAIEAGYPFREGANDTPVAKVAQFLNPQDGDLTKFLNGRLRSYFEEDWSVKKEHTEKFAPEFVNYLKNARRLRDALFPGGSGRQPNVEYKLMIASPLREAMVKIEIDGTVLEQDKPAPPFRWPGTKTGARLTVTPTSGPKIGEPQARTFGGDWGVLRMFLDGGGGGNAAQHNLQVNAGAPVRLALQPSSGTVFQLEMFRALRAPKSLLTNQ